MNTVSSLLLCHRGSHRQDHCLDKAAGWRHRRQGWCPLLFCFFRGVEYRIRVLNASHVSLVTSQVIFDGQFCPSRCLLQFQQKAKAHDWAIKRTIKWSHRKYKLHDAAKHGRVTVLRPCLYSRDRSIHGRLLSRCFWWSFEVVLHLRMFFSFWKTWAFAAWLCPMWSLKWICA